MGKRKTERRLSRQTAQRTNTLFAHRGTDTVAACVSAIKTPPMFHDAHFRGRVAQEFYPEFNSPAPGFISFAWLSSFCWRQFWRKTAGEAKENPRTETRLERRTSARKTSTFVVAGAGEIKKRRSSFLASTLHLFSLTVQNGDLVATNSTGTFFTNPFNQRVHSSMPDCSLGTCPITMSALLRP